MLVFFFYAARTGVKYWGLRDNAIMRVISCVYNYFTIVVLILYCIDSLDGWVFLLLSRNVHAD